MVQEEKRTLAIETSELVGKEVLIKGWVKIRRDHGKLIFLDVVDRSGTLQVVVIPNVSESAYEVAKELKPEYVVEIKGTVNKRPENTINKDLKTGEVEIAASELTVLHKAETLPFEIDSPELNLELPTLLDNRSLTLRNPKVAAVFKVQETIVSSYRNTLKQRGFTEIFVPTIISSAPEGGSEVFKIDYYGHDAYLAQSPQLYKQIMTSIYERVFTIAHAYRAEPSVTTRHLAEYVSLDAEMGFINSWEDLMDQAEEVIKNILSDVSEKNALELKLIGALVPQIKKEIPRLKLKEAQELVFKRTEVDHRGEPDLDPSDEKEICKWAMEESGAPFVFITHYPVKKRPFYTMPDSNDPESTLSFDLLGVSEEWVTGGQRINEYQKLVDNIRKWGNKPEDFEIYLQAFKYGMPSEGGFAMGLERITKDILGLANIREASLFPRDMERIDERFSKKTQEKNK